MKCRLLEPLSPSSMVRYVNALLLHFLTPGRRQSKTPILSRNVDQKKIETVFSIVICRQLPFDPRSSIVDYVFDCRLPGVFPAYSTWFLDRFLADSFLFVLELTF